MKQRKLIYLIVAILGILAGLLALWVTLLQGVTIQTASGIVFLIVGIVLLRRWWQGEK